MAEVEKAHALYQQHGLGARDDAMAMQYLIPGWTLRSEAARARPLSGTPPRTTMRENKLRRVWKSGGAAVNGWLAIPNSFSAETMAHQGWDSLTVDLQHGVVDYQAMVDHAAGDLDHRRRCRSCACRGSSRAS